MKPFLAHDPLMPADATGETQMAQAPGLITAF